MECKLGTSPQSETRLETVISTFHAAVAYAIMTADSSIQTVRQFKALRQPLQERFEMPSQMALQVLIRAAALRRHQVIEDRKIAVYDWRLMSVSPQKDTVSLALAGNQRRCRLPLCLSKVQKQQLAKTDFKSAELEKREDGFYLRFKLAKAQGNPE